MTPAEQLARHLATLAPLGLSGRRLAALWGYASENTIRRMVAGTQPIPDDLAAWVERLAGWIAKNPTNTR